MKKSMLSSLTAMLLMFTITACAQRGVTGNQNYITKQVSVGSFEGIKLLGSPDVLYTQKKGAPSVEVYGPDNIVPLIETYVENGNLVVRFKKDVRINNHGKLEVRVSAPALNRIAISGSGDVKFKNGLTASGDVSLSISGSGDIESDKIKCNALSVRISGSGDIDLKGVEAARAEMHITGSGDIDMAGKCSDAEYSISGSGDINGAELKAENVVARISGSGAIKCYAAQTLRGKVSGSGDVAYKGNPQTIEFSKKGLRKL